MFPVCDVILERSTRTPIMSEVCSKCDTPCFFKDVTKSKEIKDLFGGPCDMCRLTFCRNCSGVSSSEIRVLTAQIRVVTYYCPECIQIIHASVKTLPTMKKQISSIEKKLSVLERSHKDPADTAPVLNDVAGRPVDDQLSKGDFVALTTNLKTILDSQTELIGSQLNKVVINIKDANKELVRFLTQESENATPNQHKIGTTQVSEAINRAVMANNSNETQKTSKLLGAEQSIKGSNKGNLGLTAAVKQSWFHVGNLNGNTTADQLRAHLESNNIPTQVTEKLQSRNELIASFKLSVDPAYVSSILRPDLWPEDTTVKPFVFLNKSRSSGSFNKRNFFQGNRRPLNNPQNRMQNRVQNRV